MNSKVYFKNITFFHINKSVVALFDYTANGNDELTFQEGDILKCVATDGVNK